LGAIVYSKRIPALKLIFDCTPKLLSNRCFETSFDFQNMEGLEVCWGSGPLGEENEEPTSSWLTEPEPIQPHSFLILNKRKKEILF
jgi:hypothetical protein